MRGFSYSAILGATLIFIAIVSSLLWGVVYRRFNQYISTQIIITTKFSYLPINNFSTKLLSIKNISGFNLNLTNTSKIYLYPYVNNQISKENLPWSSYQYENYLIVKYYIPLNVSVKNIGNIKKFEIKNLYLPEITSIQQLEINNFFNNTSLTTFHITTDQMFKSLGEFDGPFSDILLQKLKDNYSNIQPIILQDICNKLSPLSSLVPSTSSSFFYNSGKLTYLFVGGVFIRNKLACHIILEALEKKVKDQVFLRNCPAGDCENNPGIFLIPYNITIYFIKKHITGELVCGQKGSVVSKSENIPDSVAKYLCQQAVKLRDNYCKVSESKLENEISSCYSLKNPLDCIKSYVDTNLQILGISECILENCLNLNFLNCAKNCFKRCFETNIKLNLDFYYYQPKVYVKYMVYDTNYISTEKNNPNKMYILYFKVEKIYNLSNNFLKE